MTSPYSPSHLLSRRGSPSPPPLTTSFHHIFYLDAAPHSRRLFPLRSAMVQLCPGPVLTVALVLTATAAVAPLPPAHSQICLLTSRPRCLVHRLVLRPISNNLCCSRATPHMLALSPMSRDMCEHQLTNQLTTKR